MPKKLSVVAFIQYKDRFLIGRAPNQKKWDVIKGEHDKMESFIETARREAKEETNIDLPRYPDYAWGPFPYLKGKYAKDLYLCKFELKRKPTNLKCTSTFEMHGKRFPEMVEYKWVTWKEKDEYLYRPLVRALNKHFTPEFMLGVHYETD